jgi:hypothetical protein
VGLGRRLPDRPCECAVDTGLDFIVDDCARIPHIEFTHRGERAYPVAVSPRAGSHDVLTPFATKAVLLCDDRDACHQALDIPFPGTGQCLVEVVDVEEQASLG